MEKINAPVGKTLDEIVFENRNKLYGAYLLRKRYTRNVLIALFLIAVVFAGALASIWVNELMKPEVKDEKKEEAATETYVEVKLDELPQKQEAAIFQEPPNIKRFQFTEYVEEEDKKVKEVPKQEKELETTKLGETSKEGESSDGTDGGGETTAKDENNMNGDGPKEEEFSPFTVQPKPAFDFFKYVSTHLSDRTREYIAEKGVKGRLNIMVIINKDGTIGGASLLSGLPDCKPCNEEIPEILKSMPAWNPAENNGYKVRVRINVPVVIKPGS